MLDMRILCILRGEINFSKLYSLIASSPIVAGEGSGERTLARALLSREALA